MTNERFVAVSEDEHFLYWKISRSQRMNALGTEIAKELVSLADNAKKQFEEGKKKKPQPPKAIFVSASAVNGRDAMHWIAGGDLQKLAKLQNQSQVKQYATDMQRVCNFLRSVPVPVVVVMDGVATGGGAELAIAGDIRVGNFNAAFHFKQLDVGLTTGYGGTSRLVELCGTALAERFLYGRERMDAVQAHQYGLLTHLEKDLDVGLQKLKTWLVDSHPATLAAQKNLLRKNSIATTNKLELRMFPTLWGNPMHRKILQKFK